MSKRSSKPRDLNALAASIVNQATDEAPDVVEAPETPQARAGRLGGKRGGKARAQQLTPARRSEIAKKAAEARWGKP